MIDGLDGWMGLVRAAACTECISIDVRVPVPLAMHRREGVKGKFGVKCPGRRV